MNDTPWLIRIPTDVARDLLEWSLANRSVVGDLRGVGPENPAASLREALQQRLWDGPGCAVVRGLPIDQFPPDALRAAYAAVCAQVGRILPQTVSGVLLYSVRDEGVQLDRDYGQAGVRTSKTTSAFGFHTDSPSRLAGHTPDAIGLMVLQTAKSGGASGIADGREVYRVLEAEQPETLKRLARPFWVDRRAELPPGEEPILHIPVFQTDGGFVVRYVRLYIEKGQELAGSPLTAAEREALDHFDEIAARVSSLVTLERGDIQLVNNITHLHGRTAYEDFAEQERKRHYLRIWVGRRAEA